MIASVSGTVVAKSLRDVVVEVGGVGLSILTTPTVLGQLHEGKQARLFTYLVVREDALTLYGFNDVDERAAFAVLLGIPKVGPKVALAMLTVFTAAELRQIVADKNHKRMQQVPGIGLKSAQRIILDLGDKLGAPSSTINTVDTQQQSHDSTVIEALCGLGFNAVQAEKAVQGAHTALPTANTQDLLREALKALRS